MGWIKDLAAGLWSHLTRSTNGRAKERALILTVTVLIAVTGYHVLADTIAPHRNLARAAWSASFGPDYRIISGGKEGIYRRIGDAVEAESEDAAQISNHPLKPHESAGDNVNRLLATPRSLALCQEDVLDECDLEPGQVRVVGPVYDERLHIVYRRSLLPPDATPLELSRSMPAAQREILADARIRTSTDADDARKMNVARQILHLCRIHVQPQNIVAADFDGTKRGLERPAHSPQRIDVAFMMGGAPLPAVDNLEQPERFGLASLEPTLIRELNDWRDTRYKSASLFGEYATELGGAATLGVRAMLISRPEVPLSVVRAAAQGILGRRFDIAEGLEIDAFGTLQRVSTTYPSTWEDQFKSWLLAGAVLAGVFVLTFHLLSTGFSKVREIRHTRTLTGIYNQDLPRNVELTHTAPIPVPEQPGDPVASSEQIIRGLAALFELTTQIRNQYEAGGLTVQHHTHLIQLVHATREVFRSQLGRRLIQLARTEPDGAPPLRSQHVDRLFYAGYLLTDDYAALHRILAGPDQPEPTAGPTRPGGSAGVGRAFADGTDQPAG